MPLGPLYGASGAMDGLQELLIQRLRQQALQQQQQDAEFQRAMQLRQADRADRTDAENTRRYDEGVNFKSREMEDQFGAESAGRADLENELRDVDPAVAKSIKLSQLTGRNVDLTKQPTPIKLVPIDVPGPNGRPMRRLVPENDPSFQEGIPIYQKPDAPTQGREPAQPSVWVEKNGDVRFVTPTEAAQLAQQGFRRQQTNSSIETAQDRQRGARLSAARQFLGRLDTLREKINTKMGPQAGAMGLARQGKAAIGMDPDVAEYERERAAGGRALAVAIMGAQNLSDQDAKAWADMLPGARVDKETAKRLMAQIESMLSGMGGDSSQTPGAKPSGIKVLSIEEVP